MNASQNYYPAPHYQHSKSLFSVREVLSIYKKVTDGKDAPLTLTCIRFYCLAEEETSREASLPSCGENMTLIQLLSVYPTIGLPWISTWLLHVRMSVIWGHDMMEKSFYFLFLILCCKAVTGLLGPAGMSESSMLGGLWKGRNRQRVSDSVNVFRSGRV